MQENALFDASYARVFGEGVGLGEQATPFFAAFYRHFLEDPGVADTFSGTDMARQVAMLRKSFFHLITFYLSHEPTAELTRIAQLHHRIGIDPGFYDLWLDALLNAVAEFDPDYDPATELSWRLALTPGITYMRLVDRFPEHGAFS
jgi:hemoglobin-like flavoprotein